MVLNPSPDPSTVPDPEDSGGGPPVFLHPPWMVGVVLVFAVLSLVAGLKRPIWLLVGSPFILTLAIYLWVRAAGRRAR